MRHWTLRLTLALSITVTAGCEGSRSIPTGPSDAIVSPVAVGSGELVATGSWPEENFQTSTLVSVTTSMNVKLGNPRYGGRFYGNWCGPGWSGGKTGRGGNGDPVDDLDRQCRFHDGAYAAADDYWTPIYRRAKTSKARKEVCKSQFSASWFSAYRSADVAFTTAVRQQLPFLFSIPRDRPDAWNYDPRVFGAHPLDLGQRNDYKVFAITLGNLGLFTDPPCST